MLTWIYDFRSGNKTIYVVFDEESELSGPRTPNLRPDKVFEKKKVPYTKLKKIWFNMLFLLILVVFNPFSGLLSLN